MHPFHVLSISFIHIAYFHVHKHFPGVHLEEIGSRKEMYEIMFVVSYLYITEYNN